MTSGVIVPASLGLETNINADPSRSPPTDSKPSAALLDGDTSTEGSISPDLLISNEVPALNANAPAFTSASSMTPVLITKNVEIGNERWKTHATIVEENITTLHHPVSSEQLHQAGGFIATDGVYYWPADMLNGFGGQPVLIENIPNGTVVTDHEPVFAQPTAPLNHPAAVITNGEMVPQPQPLLISTTGGDLSVDELKRSIQNQFEYYFSRENLATDQYLNSQMDGDQYVPISTVAKFNQVRKLTSDIALIVDALRDSPYVQIDETEQKVRANIKRCIVILREIPEATPIENVKALFASPNCPKWTSFEYAYNDNWYVTFDCEDDAKDAYRYLREEVQSFQGRPLMARIKAKTMLSRTVYLPKSTPSGTSSTPSPPADSSTTHFTTTAQPVAAYNVAHPQQIFSQQQANFPFYTTNVNGIIPAGQWFNTRFIQPEIRPKNYAKFGHYQGNKQLNGQRPYFPNSKPRNFRNSNNYNNTSNHSKVPFHERNGNVAEQEDTRVSSVNNASASNRRPNHPAHAQGNNNTNNTNYRGRDDPRFVRHSNPRNRNNSEEGPRFQRLRERRGKDDVPLPASKHEKNNSSSTSSESIQVNTSQMNGSLDLALDFPALPSPNSPNESAGSSSTNRSASSLKELATNALNDAETKTSEPLPTQPTSSTTTASDTDSAPLETSETAPSKVTRTENNASATTTIPPATTQSGIPKTLSYAQMAQKPNSNKENILMDDDVSDTSDADVKKSKDKTSNGKSSRKTTSNKGSPKAQRKQNEKNELNEQAPSVTSPVMKESYASKFGSASSNDSSKTSGRPKGPPTSINIAKGNGTAKSNILPAPRPLMSKVINPPLNKMDEVNGLQQPPQPISFSDTVKKTVPESSSVPTSPKGVEGTQSSIVATSPPPLPSMPATQTTIENENEKTNS